MSMFYAARSGARAEVIAAIGCHRASRCINIHSVPRSITEDSLRVDLSRFGQVEKLELFKKSKGPETGKSFTRVHFFSIKSAMRAKSAIMEGSTMSGTTVHFRLERFDYSLRYQVVALKRHTKPLEPLARNVLLTDFSRNASKRILSLVHKATAAVSLHGEVVQNISTTDQTYLTFMRPEHALLFVNVFNTHISSGLPEGARLGATRTLCIFGTQNWEQITRRRILDDFSKFGEVIDTHVSVPHTRAFIVYNDIDGAMRAIDRIRFDKQIHERYGGTQISFVHGPSSTIPRVVAVPIPGGDVQEIPVTGAPRATELEDFEVVPDENGNGKVDGNVLPGSTREF
ncbi:hypothetical protein L218DRAFT_943665 [Marasmius fiardii PR-910]|nr:hypothetical protein L218DRAFT_943665 [Marasmius fiardii PR-910]